MISPPCGRLLRPHPWRLGDSPPSPPQDASAPLVLLIDGRDPLPPPRREALLASLSATERQRHAAYRRPADQRRFLVARGALRQLLGHWLDLAPAAVSIEVGSHGKPHSAGAPPFNLSHSGDLILLAFHHGVEVGVDVEQVKRDLDWSAIATRVFPPAQVAALEALPEEARVWGFFTAWCRLEALLKARGEGLAGLDQLRRREWAGAGTSGAAVWDVAAPPGYAAGAALRSPLKVPGGAAAGGRRPSPPV